MTTNVQNPSNRALLTPDLQHEICSFLTNDDIDTMSQCSLAWLIISLQNQSKRLQDYVRKEGFGAHKWERYLGKVRKIPIPFEVWKILNSRCPFWPDKKVRDTHMFFLVPETVEDKPLTLHLLEHLSENAKKLDPGSTIPRLTTVFDEVDGKTTIKPRWVLMTKYTIRSEASQNTTRFWAAIKSNHYYASPRPPIIEAVIGLITHYIVTKKRLGVQMAAKEPWCEEPFHWDQRREFGRLAVGYGAAGDVEVTRDDGSLVGRKKFYGPHSKKAKYCTIV